MAHARRVGPAILLPLVRPSKSGRAVPFDVLQWRSRHPAFAMRFEGKVVAYLNRCAHVPTEMDWQDGQFLDADKESSSAASTARCTTRAQAAVSRAAADAWARLLSTSASARARSLAPDRRHPTRL